MGVLAGDNQGWPNGRRLGDDVIDIAEQAVGGFLKGTKLPLGDGVNGDDRNLLGSFPYIADPQSGLRQHEGQVSRSTRRVGRARPAHTSDAVWASRRQYAHQQAQLRPNRLALSSEQPP